MDTMKKILILIMLLLLTGCTNTSTKPEQSNVDGSLAINNENTESASKQDAIEAIKSDADETATLINKRGNTVEERVRVPKGFQRVEAENNSYEQYLRELPVKPDGTKIKLYNGEVTDKAVHAAVLDIDVGNRDLQQCADAVIRLRAEYLYGQGLYEKIHFNFTNGFNAEYSKWMNGYRIEVKENKTYWVEKTDYSREYSSFRKYLDMVFAYAGTLSLSKEMKFKSIENMQIGDVFLKGDTPGHTVIILDMAENISTGEKIFLIAQSYMPAQDIHILRNFENGELSPWYSVNFGEALRTPEWKFEKGQLMRFQD
ncbi:uncharacterized protein DUF4846 [Ruminiclostridium sufflavum DSM 19573]|uniref:Uncharacterized protein DUF4846 n=1 Tax=Ruminiclostridium sufflavum DSM 19573 TaxID=1121337 RepID=A0A318XMF1_9FIRM|nr:DUF4846 domain-containing protein [Ruminiclostridium sufflavum]PYG87739.1 uncharacterized protein DUF4846 [Ruminiclostridium sufflavum DSM 19573]